MSVNTVITKKESLAKLQRYCAYQERCIQDVTQKLYDLGVNQKFHKKIIEQLKKENFINEERFAQLFARGKFNLKKWGKVKITQALKEKYIPQKLINKGLKEIDDQEYVRILLSVLKSKATTVKTVDPYQKRHKIAKYAIAKGFEPELVWELMKKIKG